MRLNYYFSLVICLSLYFSGVSAKENKYLLKANYYYYHYAYFEAIPYFEKIADEVNDPVVYSRLGDCYSIVNNFAKASEAYSKAVNINGCSNTVILRYAQLLMQLSQYDEAQKWLKVYQISNKDDNRAAKLISACATAKSILQSIPQGTATLLAFNTDGSDFAPTLWKSKLVFASDTAIDVKKKTDNWTGKSYYNIYSIQCDNKGQCNNEFNKLVDTKDVNIKYHTGPCTFSADGKQMYFSRSRYNDGFFSKKSVSNKDSVVLLEIMIANEFDTASKKFKNITPFEYNSEDYSSEYPSVSPNGKVLIFSSNMPKGYGGTDLYICKKMMNKWSIPQNVGNIINTEGEEVFPYWADDTTLFFSSDGQGGLGGLDIYKCIWNEKTNAFSSPENIGTPINSSYDDISLALYADGRSTYFSSNRPASKGGDNIYFYKKEKIFLLLNVIDSISKQPLSDVKIALISSKDNRNTMVDNSGQLFIPLYPEMQYAIEISKTEYNTQQISINATTTKEVDTILKKIALFKPPIPDVAIPKLNIQPVTPTSFTKLIGTPIINNVYEIGHFYFAYNSAELNDTAKTVLDSLADYLTINQTMRIQVRAHTDCRGGDAYNLKLSNDRAISVVNYLKGKGISSTRLEYVGLGMRMPKIECPICEQCTEEQHYLNRVLEFKILHL